MSAGKTRCKPGDRALVINAGNQENIGLIVVVARPYQDNELVEGFSWHNDGNAWVVVSLGALVKSNAESNNFSATRTAVMDDACLVPLDDEDDGLTRKSASTRRKPAKKSSGATA